MERKKLLDMDYQMGVVAEVGTCVCLGFWGTIFVNRAAPTTLSE